MIFCIDGNETPNYHDVSISDNVVSLF